MRLVWIGGNHPRHLYYINHVAEHFPLSGALIETREHLIPKPPPGIPDGDRALFERHFTERAAAELKYFGEQPLPDTTRLEVQPGALNTDASAEYVRGLAPEVVLIFGCGLIKPPLVGVLPQHSLNLHLGLSPRYRGAATLFWPFYFMEPTFAGTTFHYIVSEPDAGDVVHQVTPSLSPEDGIHDVACKAVVASAQAAVRLLEAFEQTGPWRTHRQRATGKNFLASDFKPEHLRVIYQVFDNDMVRRYLDGELASKAPWMFRQFDDAE